VFGLLCLASLVSAQGKLVYSTTNVSDSIAQYGFGSLRPPLLLPSCKKLEFKTVSVDGLGSGMGKW